MQKSSYGLPEMLGAIPRTLGSVSGAGAPKIFQRYGGPLTGMLTQSLAFGLPAYLLGRYVLPRFNKDIDPKRTGAVLGLAGASMGPLLNMKQVLRNRDMRKIFGPAWSWNTSARAYYAPTNTEQLSLLGRVLTDGRVREQLFQNPEAYMEAIRRPWIVKEESYDPSGALNYSETFSPSTSGAYGIPIHYTLQQIDNDPYLSPYHKAIAARHIQEAAGPQRSGLISWSDVRRAAVGAGVGYTGAKLFGKTLGAIFGGIPTGVQKRLTQSGVVAGMLVNTGILK